MGHSHTDDLVVSTRQAMQLSEVIVSAFEDSGVPVTSDTIYALLLVTVSTSDQLGWCRPGLRRMLEDVMAECEIHDHPESPAEEVFLTEELDLN